MNIHLKGVTTLNKTIAILATLLSFVACGGVQPMTSKQVSDEISRINRELPQKINDHTILESVSYDQAKSTMVSHYTVDSWDGANVLARKQSKHLFCEVLAPNYRDNLFSMAANIELEYRTADGWIQYAFRADKDTCKD